MATVQVDSVSGGPGHQAAVIPRAQVGSRPTLLSVHCSQRERMEAFPDLHHENWVLPGLVPYGAEPPLSVPDSGSVDWLRRLRRAKSPLGTE